MFHLVGRTRGIFGCSGVFFFLDLNTICQGEAWVRSCLKTGRIGVPKGHRTGPGSLGSSHHGSQGAGQSGAPGEAPAQGIRHLPGDGNGPSPGHDVGLWVGLAL